MIKFFHRGFLIAAMFFVGITYTGAYFSDSVSSSGNTFTAGTSSHSDIVLNEIYANPPGTVEDLPMPGGEWIELYNKGAWSIDVSGWYLYDALNAHDLQITTSNVGGGSTVIPTHGYLAVYRNGDPDFSLNNGSETVRLLDGILGVGTLIDSFNYSSTIEDKTWSRIPNGTGAWSDNYTPTPGGPNA